MANKAKKNETELKFPNPYWAVFNNHVNGADEKALAVVSTLYSQKDIDWIEKTKKTGIMAIFDSSSMRPVAHDYAIACFIFANKLS